MNRKSFFGWMLSLVMLSHVIGPVRSVRRVVRCVDHLGHDMRACFDDWVAPHGHCSSDRGILGSRKVLHARRRLRAVACFRGRFAVAGGGERRAFSECSILRHSSVTCLLAYALSHVRVVLACAHRVSVRAAFASLSASSLPVMFMCPGVHFPLILQPLCCKTFASSRHALM